MSAESRLTSDLGRIGLAKAFAALLLVIVLPLDAAQATVSTVDRASTEKLDSRDPNYMRCRKILETGSLVKKQRICKTNAEWAKVNDEMQRNADNLIGRNRVGFDCRATGATC